MSQTKAARRKAARELLRRLRCQQSLHSFALNITIPTAPHQASYPDEDLVGPARDLMPIHQAKIFDVLQRTMTRKFGRAIIMAPPGSTKSLSTVVACAWEMGRKPGCRIIYTSYGSDLAEQQSSRVQLITQQEDYATIFENTKLGMEGVKRWHMLNGAKGMPGSEMIAAGLTAGITGNRATGWVIDDPVKGREDADSEAFQQKTVNSYVSDLKTRVLPGAWGVLILTRWSERDLAGYILPEDYDGRSGMVKGRDGLDWEVLSIAAKCEREDDPLGRKPGEYMWPEWFTPEHWRMFEEAEGTEAARDWASLYQQRPAAKGSGRFTEEMFDFYKPGTQPPIMAYIGAGDYAVTEGKNDFTELGVFGVDPQGHLWEVDWWHKQAAPEEGGDRTIDMIGRWKTPMWFHEGGVIDKSLSPYINLRMRERKIFTDRRALPSMRDKVAKCASFQARAAAGLVHFRDNANSRRVVQQLVALPAGRYDDAADVCGLVGRALDQFPIVREHKPPKQEEGLKPFSVAWLEYTPPKERNTRFY